ncbi:MAG: FAD-binding protein [Actinomycetia bacterium]|nr:FAD-binding protein [Actinomycetes bacterium]
MTSASIDVLVAGAGAAGLAAALSASDSDLDVVVVETSPSFRSSSNTAMSTSMVPAAGSRWQSAAGIEDSPQQFYADIMSKTKGQADPVIARALTNIAPELVEWMADSVNVPFELVTDFRYPGHSVDRCLAVPDRSGATMHRHMLESVGHRSTITLMNPMRLESIDIRSSGFITCVVEGPDHVRETVTTRSVVIATNGFAAHGDLVSQHLPEIEHALYHGGSESKGDSLVLGEQINADVAFLDSYQGHGSVAIPHGVIMTWAAVMQGAVLVNREGVRFGDETVGYSEYAVPVLEQPGGFAWVVLDERINAACSVFKDYRDLLNAGGIRWSATVEGLASIVGAESEPLGSTLKTAASLACESTPDSFGRVFTTEPLTPPYGAVKVTGALFHTQGGLLVDGDARVLSGGTPINGVYAAGGAAAGISGHGASGYLAGNGLLSALGLGYLAGRHVAQVHNPTIEINRDEE